MCGITINSQEGSGSDGKINDLKLRDSKKAALVSVYHVYMHEKTICLIMMLGNKKNLSNMFILYLSNTDMGPKISSYYVQSFNVGRCNIY